MAKKKYRALVKLEWSEPAKDGGPRTVIKNPGDEFSEDEFPENGNLKDLIKHHSAEEVRG